MTDMIEHHGLGRRYAPDPRDHQWLLPPKSIEESLRTQTFWFAPGPVLDQGPTPMCVAYATDKWLQASPIRNKLIDPVVLYHEAQLNDEWPGEDYDGTSVRGAMKALKLRGEVSNYQWAFDLDTVVYYLLETAPMVFGTNWYDDMFAPDEHGYLHPTGGIAGGHAYVGIGVHVDRENPDGSTGAIRMINSWGVAWGEKGRAWLTFDDFARLLSEAGEACMGVEVKIK